MTTMSTTQEGETKEPVSLVANFKGLPWSRETQLVASMFLCVASAGILGGLPSLVSSGAPSESACAPPKDYSSSELAGALAYFQLSLLVGLTVSLLYGPVHYDLLAIACGAVHATLSILYVGWPPVDDTDLDNALLYVSALAPGAVIAFHYASLHSDTPWSTRKDGGKLLGLGLSAASAAVVQTGLSAASLNLDRSVIPPVFTLVAGVFELVGVAVTVYMYYSKFI